MNKELLLSAPGGGEFKLSITFSLFGNSANALTNISIYSDGELIVTLSNDINSYDLICDPNKTYVLDRLTEGNPEKTDHGVVRWTTNNVDIVSSTASSYRGYYDSIQIKVTANNAMLNLEYSYGRN